MSLVGTDTPDGVRGSLVPRAIHIALQTEGQAHRRCAMFVGRWRRNVAPRRGAMCARDPPGYQRRHIAPRWGALASTLRSTNIQLLTELRKIASLNVQTSLPSLTE